MASAAASRTIPSATLSALRERQVGPGRRHDRCQRPGAGRAQHGVDRHAVDLVAAGRQESRQHRQSPAIDDVARRPQLARQPRQLQTVLQVGRAHHADDRAHDLDVLGRAEEVDGLGDVQLSSPRDDLAQASHPFRHDRGVGRSRQVGDAGHQLGRRDVFHRARRRELVERSGDILRALDLAVARGGLRRGFRPGRPSARLLGGGLSFRRCRSCHE